MNKSVEKRGAELALEESINEMLGKARDFKCSISRGADPDGEKRAKIISNHIQLLNDAYDYWSDAFSLLLKIEKKEDNENKLKPTIRG